MLREHYLCPHFRILVMGRANAGKTTILEKVCGVARGTRPIIYYGSKLRGKHDIEHQITYPGSNFIFHDSLGFESGSTEELGITWKFIEKKSAETELKNQLHAIWYCIPMDDPRPILPAELEFFNKGTGRDKWERARNIAEITFQQVYLPKVLEVNYPPKAFVRFEDLDLPENDCAELTQTTADVIDSDSMHQLFISTQMNNLDLCVKSALR
ncbi:hypothetical protein F5887DRAFT_1065308 [Amanita rubescens]|nr:hypothetical protein F5887DRAFT_1065308 [Amanita rubescens]